MSRPKRNEIRPGETVHVPDISAWVKLDDLVPLFIKSGNRVENRGDCSIFVFNLNNKPIKVKRESAK